jgi:hypothetical protein
MNLKKNMTLIVGGAITLVLLIILLVLMLKFNSSYQKVNRQLQSAQQRLTILNGRDPFPSEENVSVVQTNLAVLQNFFHTLMASLQQGQAESRKLETAEFNLLLDRTNRRLYQRASAMKVALPLRFAFAFDRYAAGTLPDSVDVPRLVTQLEAVELLCGLLYASKVSEILAIERPVFEAAARSALTETFTDSQQQRYGGEQSAAAPATPADETYMDPSGLFSRERYVLTFRGRDTAVLAFLNAVAANKRFVVVTRLQLENEMGIPKVGAPVVSAAGGPTPPVAPAGPAAREQRIVAGREIVKVIVEVEVYRFQAPASGEAPS